LFWINDPACPAFGVHLNVLAGNKRVELPDKLEGLVGHAGHFASCFAAKVFFGNPANINAAMEAKVGELFA
jgi:hypothetical protein